MDTLGLLLSNPLQMRDFLPTCQMYFRTYLLDVPQGCDTGSSLPLLKLSKAEPIHCSCSACIILYLVINFALLYHATGQVFFNIYLVWVGLQDPCGTLPTQDSLWFYLQTCHDSKVSTDKQQPLEMWHRCTKKGDHIWQHFPKIPVGEKAFPMQTHVS